VKGDRTGTVLMLAALLVACGGGESRWAGTITDSAGVMIVSNPAVGIWTDADRWTVEEELRIGVREGDPEYQFGEIIGITVDSHGRIFVLDWQAQHIKVFSPEGVYEQSIGGRGGGPGELLDAVFIAMGMADTLLVAEVRGNRRVNRYAPDGSSLGSYRIPFAERFALLIRSSPSGEVAAWVRPFAMPGQPEPEKIDRILVLSPAGTVTDTLLTFPSGETFSQGGPSFSVMLFAPEPAWDITEDSKLLFGVNDRYRIGLYAFGKLERVIEKPFERKSIPDGDRQFHLGRLTPRGRDIIAGPNGTIWVQYFRPVSELSDTERETLGMMAQVDRIIITQRDFHGAPDWDVFDAEGRYLGVLTMPPRFVPRLIRGDKIYGIQRDEFNVEYVVRLRIVGDLGAGAT